MNICLPFCQSEYGQSLEWLKWIKDFCGFQANHSLFLLPFKGLDHRDVLISASTAFGSVEVIQDAEGVRSDWKNGQKQRDARGPNSFFRQAAWHFYYLKKGQWFFCEPDCIVIRKDAFDLAEAEYRACGKPFLGTIVQMSNDTIPMRLNGVAIYPEKTPEIGSTLLQMKEFPNGMEVAFDIAGAQEVVRKSHNSVLFRHDHFGEGGRIPTFPADKGLLGRETAFFHRCKDGSLYRMLGAGLTVAGVNGSELAEEAGSRTRGKTSVETEDVTVHVQPSSLTAVPVLAEPCSGDCAMSGKSERSTQSREGTTTQLMRDSRCGSQKSFAQRLEEYDRIFTQANPKTPPPQNPPPYERKKRMKRKRKFSPEALERMRAAALKRWAKKRSASSDETVTS